MKFRTKILLCLMLVLSLSLGIVGTMIISGSFRDALDLQWQNAATAYQMTISALEMSGRTDVDSISQALGQIQQLADWDCVRLKQDEVIIYQLGNRFMTHPKNSSSMEYTAQLLDDGYIQFSGNISIQGLILELTLVKDVSTVYDSVYKQLSLYRTVFVSTITLGGIICWLLAYLLTIPISKVSWAARQIAQGDWDVRLQSKARDEIGQLSRNFNYMAQQLQENIRSLENAMAAQERFIGSFAHELKTPMTSIIGYADLLRTQSLDEREAQNAANYIFSEAKRLESLSLKLLRLLVAKNEEFVQVDISVKDMVYTLAEHLLPVYKEENIRLSCYCQTGTCRGDPELLQSVLINLLDNARKAMDSGGDIRIIVEFEESTCQISVIDNGRGIPADVLDHLTEAFYRVDKSRSRAQGGAGLGLALCQEIISRHGGTIQFFSTPGKGTTVVVSLPREKEVPYEA